MSTDSPSVSTDTPAPATELVLDRPTIRMLRQAQRVCWHWLGSTYGELSEGTMRLIRTNVQQDGWTGTESEAVLTLQGKATCYSGAKFDPPTVRCFAWEGFAYSNPYWKTFVTFLHPGDILEMHWIGSNNNQYLEAAKLHHDQLAMVIRRGKNRLEFAITEGICGNNSARMFNQA
jgi:hypothetical protein